MRTRTDTAAATVGFGRPIGFIHHGDSAPLPQRHRAASYPSQGSAMRKSVLAVSAASALVLAGLIACAPPQKDNSGGETSSGVKVSDAKSAADFGGMDALVAAAKKEGELNVIALPPDWANYGASIKVNSAQPDAASQDEINAANEQKGKSTAPDVFDLGQSVALANTSMFARYKVATFDDIPAAFKDPTG